MGTTGMMKRVLERIFAWYIPTDFHADPILLTRAKSQLALSFAVVLAGPSFMGIYYALGHKWGALAIMLAVLVLMVSTKLALSVFKSLAGAQAANFFVFTALFSYLLWSTGGQATHALAAWFVVVPLVMTFGGGAALGAVSLLAVMAILGGFEACHWLGVAMPTSPIEDMRLLGVVSTLGLIPFVSVVAMGFQVAKEQSDREREAHLQTVESLMAEVGTQSSQVRHRVDEMAQALEQQSEQARAMRDTTDASNALAQSMQDASRGLANEAELAQSIAHEGASVVGAAIEKTIALAEAINQAGELVNGLQSRSRQISDIADQIKQLAFQTNILALNATIEAAHAGNQGRGFAVVADNVRKLAGQAGDSASAISHALADVLANVDQTAGLLANGQSLAESGRREADKAKGSLQSIIDSVKAFNAETMRLQSESREQVSRNAELLRHAAQMEQGIHLVANGSTSIRGSMGALTERLRNAS